MLLQLTFHNFSEKHKFYPLQEGSDLDYCLKKQKTKSLLLAKAIRGKL